MKSPLWNRVTIVGCGLIGASFALALRHNNLAACIAGWDISDSVLAEALGHGIIDEADYSFVRGEASNADLIYLALPVNAIVDLFKQHSFAIKAGAVVTDAGSTKSTISQAASEYLPRECCFIGGHPIAGSHLSGLKHVSADLFAGKPYILIANETEVSEAFTALSETIASLDARVVLMTAREHDRAMAFVSHLPQLMSSVLNVTVKSSADASRLLEVAGSGYTDMTRLALSSWSIWKDILVTNHFEITLALDDFIERLQSVRDELRLLDQNGAAELPLTRSIFKNTQ